jgi:hypothetical protein
MNVEKRPNLFVIGAMKSGTTTLHSYLQTHPDIFMCEPKEPFYFVREKNWKLGEKWYLSLFADATHHTIIGESTTDYTKKPHYDGVPERIREFNPEARFIYIMRDPVERTISHYWHDVRWHSEHRNILRAIRQTSEYTAVSHYAMQLEPFFKMFGQDKVFTLTFEELTCQPEETLKKIMSWLGVSDEFVLPKNDIKKNVTPHEMEQARGYGYLNRFRHSTLWDYMYKIFPHRVKCWGKSMALKKVDRANVSSDSAMRYLRPIQLEQTKRLEKMLGREFPEWQTLHDYK